jgi:hypothetical protein
MTQEKRAMQAIKRQAMVVAFLLASLVLVAAARPAPAQACTNEAIRAVQRSTFLPECRAYELVSPGSNPYLENTGAAEGARASVTGDGIAYYSYYPADGVTRSGFFYVASRGADGWSTEEVAPQDSPAGSSEIACRQSVYFSDDLVSSVLADGWNSEEETPGESYCQSSEEPLAAGAPAGFGNLFLRESSTSPYQLVNITPGTATASNARLEDANSDLSRILFGENAGLTPEAEAGYNLYEWVGGTVHLVSFLPGGAPVVGKLANGGSSTVTQGTYQGFAYALAPVTHAMSADGEKIFFYAEDEKSTNLYLRINATQPQSAVSGTKVNGEQCIEPDKACTIQIDVSHGTGTSGAGVFWDAGETGERVFFSDEKRLTPGAGAMSEEPDLYEYDLETGQLTDITPEALAGGPANARGFSGSSEDGSYLYFVAKGDLTGAQHNSQGATAQGGEPDLYLYHEKTLTFIATLLGKSGFEGRPVEEDFDDWQEAPELRLTDDGELRTRVSPNGVYVAFSSLNQLTHFANADATTGKPDKELFVYDAEDNQLACASCKAGEKPLGSTDLPLPMRFSSEKPHGAPTYLSRNVFDDGRVFFTSPDKLAPQDTNGTSDVYEYAEGQTYLISTGTSSAGSTFYDASPSGDDVFFVTAQSLVSADTDNSDSIYDARVDGGFTEPPLESETCGSELACRPGGEGMPALITPATPMFKGSGNVVAQQHSQSKCGKARKKRRGKCVKSRKRVHRRKKGKGR